MHQGLVETHPQGRAGRPTLGPTQAENTGQSLTPDTELPGPSGGAQCDASVLVPSDNPTP